MTSIRDDRGYNQGYALVKSTEVRMRRRADFLLEGTEPSAGKSILEIGCGTGEISYWMAQKTSATVLGTDLCVPYITAAAERYTLPNLRYAVLDFNRAGEFQGERFDHIVGNGILHHLCSDLDGALANMRRLLKKGGTIAFCEPNYGNPYVYLIFTIGWLRRRARLEPDEMAFSRQFALAKLNEHGYQEVAVEYRDFLLPGVPEVFITPSIVVGDVAERVPLVRGLAQSLFIRARSG